VSRGFRGEYPVSRDIFLNFDKAHKLRYMTFMYSGRLIEVFKFWACVMRVQD
jgi:hypothetical protein